MGTPKWKVDMVRAIGACQNSLRAERKARLEALDREFMQALEDGNLLKQKLITAQKKKLRDITQHGRVKNAKNLQELQAFIQDFKQGKED